MKLWPWQCPGTSTFFSVDGAYEIAYAAPARERQHGNDEYRGYLGYLLAARVRGLTTGEGQDHR